MPSWAGLWDGVYAQPYAPLNEPTSTERGIARLVAPEGVLAIGAVGTALTGAAVGANATATVTQVSARRADGANMGGLVPMQTMTLVNRNTTAADEVRMDASLKPVFAPVTYPVDKSGNGGGGKLGTL